MITFLIFGLGAILLIGLVVVIFLASTKSGKNKKPSPNAQGSTPTQTRATGSGDD